MEFCLHVDQIKCAKQEVDTTELKVACIEKIFL